MNELEPLLKIGLINPKKIILPASLRTSTAVTSLKSQEYPDPRYKEVLEKLQERLTSTFIENKVKTLSLLTSQLLNYWKKKEDIFLRETSQISHPWALVFV